jgi:hypothetical protein
LRGRTKRDGNSSRHVTRRTILTSASRLTLVAARNLVRAYVAYEALQVCRLVVAADVAMLAPDAHKLAGIVRF